MSRAANSCSWSSPDLVLDSGALVALERNDRAMWRRFKSALLASQVPVTHGGTVGQVWRARGSRQAPLTKVLDGIDVRPLDEQLGREASAVLAQARMSDVIDAAVVLLARDSLDACSICGDPQPLAARNKSGSMRSPTATRT